MKVNLKVLYNTLEKQQIFRICNFISQKTIVLHWYIEN